LSYEFLKKIKHNSRITKFVGYFTTNPAKLVLHFYDFSTIFYAIYKKQPNHFTIGVNLLQGGPRKDSGFCNVVLGAAGRCGGVKSGEARRSFGRGRTGGGSRVTNGSVWVVGLGGEAAGGGCRRRTLMAAAVELAPAR
jgi:hypothetical protein